MTPRQLRSSSSEDEDSFIDALNRRADQGEGFRL